MLFAPQAASAQALPSGELLGVDVPVNFSSLDPSVKSVRVTCWLDSGLDPVTGQQTNLGAAPQGAFAIAEAAPDAQHNVKKTVHVSFTATAFRAGVTAAAINSVGGGYCQTGLEFASDTCLQPSPQQTTGPCGHANGTPFLVQSTFKFGPAPLIRSR